MHSTEVRGQEEVLALGPKVPLWNEQADFTASEMVAKRAYSDLPKLRGGAGESQQPRWEKNPGDPTFRLPL